MEKAAYHGNRKKKGLTLVETIVALGIISAVSVATVSIVFYSANALRNTAVKSFFTHEVSAYSEIYISYHDDASAYQKAMLQYSGKTVTLGEDYTFYYDGKFNPTDVTGHAYAVLLDFDTSLLRINVTSSKGSSVMEKEVRL